MGNKENLLEQRAILLPSVLFYSSSSAYPAKISSASISNIVLTVSHVSYGIVLQFYWLILFSYLKLVRVIPYVLYTMLYLHRHLWWRDAKQVVQTTSKRSEMFLEEQGIVYSKVFYLMYFPGIIITINSLQKYFPFWHKGEGICPKNLWGGLV